MKGQQERNYIVLNHLSNSLPTEKKIALLCLVCRCALFMFLIISRYSCQLVCSTAMNHTRQHFSYKRLAFQCGQHLVIVLFSYHSHHFAVHSRPFCGAISLT